MNIDRIIKMIINQILRRMVNGGINKGINFASGMGKGSSSNLTPEQQIQAKEYAKRSRKLAQMSRRNSKF